MPSKKWASKEQETYLLSYEERYLAAQETGAFHNFWPQMMEGWFKEFPEVDVVFPNKPYGVLTEEEAGMLATAIGKRRKVN